MNGLVARAAIFIVLAPGTAIAGVPALILWLTDGAPAGAPPLVAVGIGIIALGAAIFAWCVYDFLTAGRGTPDPNRPPERLVVRGLYGVVRNPMYVGVLTAVVGEAALFASIWLMAWAAALFIAFHLRVLVYEEPALARTFGAEWETYRHRVPRWVPRLSR